ncbi:hypothetical protein QAD02_001142 [Eretmocerus hayati]|uniref:Uncharacterized protein n=1 Tax=Eretmocerus hayati TaxID=131215 RepID=A0ACC2NG77_9HYME|nr:hypothetical protein QAD02_001142 [Eretmocerus hayati]
MLSIDNIIILLYEKKSLFERLMVNMNNLPVEIRLTCRLCFGSCRAEEACNLIDNELNQKLIDFASVQVQEIDGMPMIACQNCSNLINVAHSFKCQIEKSGQKLDQNVITGLPTLWPTMSLDKRNDDIGLIEAVSPQNQDDIFNICSLIQEDPSVNNHEQIILDIINSCTEIDTSELPDLEQLSEIVKSLEQEIDVKSSTKSVTNSIDETSDKNFFSNLVLKNTEEEEEKYFSDDEKPLILRTKRHKCNYCIKSFADLTSLKKHTIEHKMIYVCYLCEAQFPSINEVQRHYKIAHALNRNDKTKNEIDPFKIESDSGKIEDSNPTFICEHCTRCFSKRDLLITHLKCHVGKNLLRNTTKANFKKNVNKSEETDKQSDGANYNLRNKKHSVLESMDVHKNLPKNEISETVASQTVNQIQSLNDQNENQDSDKIQCRQCGKYYKTLKILRKHLYNRRCLWQDENKIIVKQGRGVYDRPFKCHRCYKSFSNAKILANHEKKHIQKILTPTRYLCEICSSSFTQKQSLKAHLRSHTGERPYVCKICKKAFTKSCYLMLHVRTHSGERPYICQYCNKGFSRADTLSRHLTAHTGETKYHCKVCDKSYRRLNSLKEHMFTHTGQMPYSCKFCSKKFNNGGSLHAHQKKCQSKHIVKSAPEPVQEESSPSSESTDSGILSHDNDSMSEFLILKKDNNIETVSNETTVIDLQHCKLTVVDVPVPQSLFTSLFEPLLTNGSNMNTVNLNY